MRGFSGAVTSCGHTRRTHGVAVWRMGWKLQGQQVLADSALFAK